MDTIIFVLMIALGIAICVAIREYKRAKFCKAMWKEMGEKNIKQSDELRLKGFTIDRLTKDLAKHQREEETRGV